MMGNLLQPQFKRRFVDGVSQPPSTKEAGGGNVKRNQTDPFTIKTLPKSA
jgi:hypothetical protein